MTSNRPLRVGFVPEHFSTPIHFAKKYYGLDAELIPFPSGTGHMVTALRGGEIDVGVGLTEGWIAALGKAQQAEEKGDGGFKLVGTYVETPLCWAISTGADRPEIKSVDSLQGGKIGVSRIGSGSYVMGYVLADQRGWLLPTAGAGSELEQSSPYSDFVVLNTFENLRKAVNSGDADFFMWEHFTSKRYYDNGEIRRIVASTDLIEGEKLDARVDDLLERLNSGIKYFNENQEEGVTYISTELDYSGEDAREWLKTVRFPERTQGVDPKVVDSTVEILCKAGVLAVNTTVKTADMIARQR
ncbi:hypothetical protein N0V88_007883 [Collariella sp. IMI 366227]|nr:hypothetical protein N0V88_007883 [Collariella sp. IMI 366227]